jgi:DNA-binding NarL/FixJ family response regulator
VDAVETYLSYGAASSQLDSLIEEEKILFCCYSRLLATMWVRSEKGRYGGSSPMPEHLAGACTTFKEGLDLIVSKQPTLVIATQVLEEGSGLDLISAVKEISPGLPTLLFLQHRNQPLYQEAVNTHSDGIVLESEMGSGHVIKAIEIVLKGGMYLEPLIAHALAGSSLDRNPGLTPRELEVMKYVVCGLSDREIGEEIHLAMDTVKYHLKQVFSKLGIHNRTRAAISLVLMGLVPPPRPLLP